VFNKRMMYWKLLPVSIFLCISPSCSVARESESQLYAQPSANAFPSSIQLLLSVQFYIFDIVMAQQMRLPVYFADV
jgi:hypothetical protein